MSVRRNVHTAKCPYGEMSVRRNVPTAKCPTAKYPTAKCPTAKCPTAICPFTMWKAAMDEEFSSLKAMDTYELAVKTDRKVIGGRWVFAKKQNELNHEIYKARYVAQGFNQTRDIDYSETFLLLLG